MKVNNILEKHFWGIIVLKGCQRRMIKLRGSAETIFEEAYFVIKPDSDLGKMNERDIIAEANRIIAENTTVWGNSRKKTVKLSLAAFITMIIFSTVGMTAIFAALYMLA